MKTRRRSKRTVVEHKLNKHQTNVSLVDINWIELENFKVLEFPRSLSPRDFGNVISTFPVLFYEFIITDKKYARKPVYPVYRFWFFQNSCKRVDERRDLVLTNTRLGGSSDESWTLLHFRRVRRQSRCHYYRHLSTVVQFHPLPLERACKISTGSISNNLVSTHAVYNGVRWVPIVSVSLRENELVASVTVVEPQNVHDVVSKH